MIISNKLRLRKIFINQANKVKNIMIFVNKLKYLKTWNKNARKNELDLIRFNETI